jgi:Uncharacterised nucleotidyltransferase
MSLPSIQRLAEALTKPHTLTDLSPAQWDLLIRQGRMADMLARIAADCEMHGLMAKIPLQPRRHLQSAAILTQRQHRELRWEVRLINEALARTGVPLVILKGAAYAMCGLMASRGRMMTDVDILVPRAALGDVESALMKRGWVSAAKTEYDQRYYRTWMHELPPMHHFLRGTVIDVHHAIVPLTSRSHPDSAALLSGARPVQPGNSVLSLAPIDMVLHSATHLFHEGELEQGFRGLVDIDALLREFSATDKFWRDLLPRAQQLELGRPLFYALRYCRMMLGTPVPDDVQLQVAQASFAPKSQLFLRWMDALFLRALRPSHPTLSDFWTPTARFFLYLRGHWLRMPPGLLIIHLGRKLFTRQKKSEDQE